ncbi:MAG TPA: hypothetical protein VIT44_06500 [Cyclobacteriaceae bacterium]
MTRISRILTLLIASIILLLTSCKDDDPVKEDIPELITKATLTFTPAAGTNAAVVKVTATDPDGDGPQSININGEIKLNKGITYILTLELINELANPTADEYNISAEVLNEGDEHQFYFAWTGDVFSSPAGNGNMDNRNDAVNYKDKDENNLPIGLTTEWTSISTATIVTNTFHIVLKHQPELKSASSTFDDGETDLDLTFPISVN